MPAILQQSDPFTVWADPAIAGHASQAKAGDRVLHERWGLGHLLQGRLDTDPGVTVRFVTVRFQDGVREVPGRTLRQIMPVTVLARVIEAAGCQVTAWAVRKAHDQGTIQPDFVGRFAGHKVHYYDAARVPSLIAQLSAADPWGIGTLVMHSRYGAGKIVAQGPQADYRSEFASRVVELFSSSAQVSVRVAQLRQLLPAHVVAKSVGANRKTFSRIAARRGIYPDYAAPYGHVREYYDEGRIEEIRQRWTASDQNTRWSPGSIVLDADGEIAVIVSRNAQGQVQIRNLDSPAPARPADLSTLRELVSLRELARGENMSRYKLNRLLAAAGIKPVCQRGKTLYFDRTMAHPALQARISCERDGIPLAALAVRTGVSEAVLARKVRGGQIRTLGHQGAHYVDPLEAERIEQVVRAMRSPSSSLKSLGICQLHTRGRSGAEVVSWNIGRLIEVARPLSPDRRLILFGQVAWMCDGVGRKRFPPALDACLPSLGSAADGPQKAAILLALLDRLPEEFSPLRIRLLLASEAAASYRLVEERVHALANRTGHQDAQARRRFRAQIDHALAELFKCETAASFAGLAHGSAAGARCPEDDYTEGAILVSVADRRPAVGVIVRVEQQCWDTVTHRWHKSLTVRFADGERHVCTYVRSSGGKKSITPESLLILLRTSEALNLVELLQQRYRHAVTGEPKSSIAMKAA